MAASRNEIPPGPIVGLIVDFWQRAITDVGLPGVWHSREARI